MIVRVGFRAPVLYQSAHALGRREVTELYVYAPTLREAEIHAIKTCEGDLTALTLAEVEAIPAAASRPLAELIGDETQEYLF